MRDPEFCWKLGPEVWEGLLPDVLGPPSGHPEAGAWIAHAMATLPKAWVREEARESIWGKIQNFGLEHLGDALPGCWEARLGNRGGVGEDTLAVLSPWPDCRTLQWLHCQILNSWLHCQTLNSWLHCQILNSWLHCQILNSRLYCQIMNSWLNCQILNPWLHCQLLNLRLHSPNLLDHARSRSTISVMAPRSGKDCCRCTRTSFGPPRRPAPLR